MKRNYKKYNKSIFQELLWHNTYWNNSTNDTNTLADALITSITTALDQICPKKRCKFVNSHNTKPWINEEILETIRARDIKYQAAVISKNWDIWEEYRKLRNSVVQMIRQAKNEYLCSVIDLKNRDTKQLWTTLKDILPNNRVHMTEEIWFEDRLVQEPMDIDESFNKFYIESIENLAAANTNTVTRINMKKDEPVENHKFRTFKLANMSALKEIVKCLKHTTGTEEGISTSILQDAFEVYGNRFLDVINSSLSSEVFPEQWKTSVVIPIPKVPKAKRSNEFRAINTVPVYEKMLEMVVKSQLMSFCDENNVLTPAQSGFRMGHSCESALLKICDNWYKDLDQGKIIVAVFLDFKRAFETIDRDILVDKLFNIGLRDNVLLWFKSYLDNRSQIVKYHESSSSSLPIRFGVPQGTVLGPVLFLLYINDIIEHVKYSEINLFADDTMLYITGDNIDELIVKLNADLRNLHILHIYMSTNNLFINETKSKVIVFRNNHKSRNVNNILLTINGHQLEVVDEIKYLGVILDNQLSFIPHANFLLNKMSKKYYMLNRTVRDFQTYVKLLLYKTLIIPDLDYCCSLWSNIPSFKLKELQVLQNKFMRFILKCNRYTPINDMLRFLQIMNVKDRIMYNSFITIYKIQSGLMPLYLSVKLKLNNSHSYQLRNKANFVIDICRTSKRYNSLFCKWVSAYNLLPIESKNSSSISIFKNVIRSSILNNYNYQIPVMNFNV